MKNIINDSHMLKVAEKLFILRVRRTVKTSIVEYLGR